MIHYTSYTILSVNVGKRVAQKYFYFTEVTKFIISADSTQKAVANTIKGGKTRFENAEG